LAKRHGDKITVDDLMLAARPGAVIGFLRPNEAGGATAVRMIVVPDFTGGWATVGGRWQREHTASLREGGARLDVRPVWTRRSACHPGCRRLDEVIRLAGLLAVTRKRAGGFSVRLGHRLGIADALLRVSVLDEPVNGVDPHGMLRVRTLVRRFAVEGGTVFVSSPLMSWIALIAEHLMVVGRGGLVADTSVPEFTESASRNIVQLRTPGDTSHRTDVGRHQRW
jgi:ABC-2 type transport system ATP-binding protein